MLRVWTLIVLVLLCAAPAAAQELYDDSPHTLRAEVLRVLESDVRPIAGTDTQHLFQRIEARLLEGERAGSVVTVENDFLALKEGDRFFALRYVDVSGLESYSVQDKDRRGALVVLVVLFVGAVVAFGGWYGVRALVSLFGSLFVLAYVLVPGLVSGWHPLVASFVVSSLVLSGALFLTHGINRESLVAVTGTLVAIVGTLVAAAFAVSSVGLSGFSSSETVTLNFNTRGTLDFAGLLIGGIVIGALGVLDDIAITQVALVRELFASEPTASRRSIFLRAMRVGREHVGAVVNTLALAYVGVSMPLLLLMHLSPTPVDTLLNMELFATEIVRTVVGSIGIVLTVPIVTLLAVRFLPRRALSEGGTHTHAHTHAVVHSTH